MSLCRNASRSFSGLRLKDRFAVFFSIPFVKEGWSKVTVTKNKGLETDLSGKGLGGVACLGIQNDSIWKPGGA